MKIKNGLIGLVNVDNHLMLVDDGSQWGNSFMGATTMVAHRIQPRTGTAKNGSRGNPEIFPLPSLGLHAI